MKDVYIRAGGIPILEIVDGGSYNKIIRITEGDYLNFRKAQYDFLRAQEELNTIFNNPNNSY